MCTSFYVCITTAPEVALSSILWHQAFSSIWWHQAASEVTLSSIHWHWAALSTVESEWILVGRQLCEKVQISNWTDFFRAMGPEKMASWLYLLSKLLCFERRYSQILKENLKYWVFWSKKWKMAVKKSKFWKKRLVIEPLNHEKWIPHSILHRNHCVLAKKYFSKEL